jgi:transcriptional regulator with XRE-family HTH domain
MKRFGELLRDARRKAGKTLGDVARLLGISVVYLSDVERGNRKPFGRDRVLAIAEFLQTNPGELLRAASRERGFIEYDITKARPLEADVVGGLVAGLARGGITDDELHKIQTILKRGENE